MLPRADHNSQSVGMLGHTHTLGLTQRSCHPAAQPRAQPGPREAVSPKPGPNNIRAFKGIPTRAPLLPQHPLHVGCFTLRTAPFS